jgi:uncharacterized membrane protein YqjE
MSTNMGSAGYASPPPHREQHADAPSEGIGSILGGLLKDLQDMMRGEIALARAEVREDVSTVGKAISSLAMAAILGLTGFIFLMLGATYLLNIWMRMWIAAAIVGVVLVLVAAMLGISGKNKLKAANLKPDQTIASMKENQEWAKQQINSVSK